MATSDTPAADAVASADRIAVMDAALADQIAAGEVVERPASVVKELVENAIDAGARRVDVELEAGGKKLIRVLDDGRGILPGQLRLALTRHATSKVRRADELVELSTLGFRGEALASIAAVARVRLRSRRPGAERGWELEVAPGSTGEERPVGMPVGTEVRIEQLFASLPARRKFLRSEATEVGHCVDALLRSALVEPGVRFSLRHGRRELLKLPAADTAGRVAQVLGRRGAGPYHAIEGEHDGVRIHGWFAAPRAASRQRGGAFIIVRRRVVKERSVSNIVNTMLSERIAGGHHAVYALWIEPAAGTVDVNVHPQKSEVRFSDPQRVYSALRRVLAEGLAAAPWAEPVRAEAEAEAAGPVFGEAQAGVARALEGWERGRDGSGGGRGLGGEAAFGRPYRSGAASGRGATYRLGTRASSRDYAAQKGEMRAEAARLERSALQARSEPLRDEVDDGTRGRQGGGVAAGDTALESTSAPSQPELLTCLSGPTAVFSHAGKLWAVDLRQLRGFLLLTRLQRELGGGGVVAQGLLPAISVSRSPEEVSLVTRRADDLRSLGVEAEAFGEDAVLVRAVPAALAHCRDAAAVEELLDRIIPWLRLREQSSADEDRSAGLAAMATVGGQDPTPRYARRWLADALELAPLEALPGVEGWSPNELLRR